jgi:glycosyltransferase involved in cell wall biosynthesis
VHNMAPLIYGGFAARSMLPRPRVVYSEHNQVSSASPRDVRRFGHYIRLADAAIAVSENLRDVLINKLGVTRPVYTVRNGIDDSGFANVSGDRVRSELGIGPREILIGTAVVLRREKGLTHLIQAAKTVLAKTPNARFAVAGDGPLRAELEAEATAAGLGDRLLFLGYRSDIPELLASFDIYVLPSLSEGLPLALLEALSLGKFIVCTSVGGNPEVVEDGVHGFLVPPSDSTGLADALVKAVSDPALRARARDLSPRRFKEQFSLAAMTRGHTRLFSELVGRPDR